MKFNGKKLVEALTSRGLGAVAGGASYAFGEKYVPINNNVVRLGLLGVVGAIIPEIQPKSKFLDSAGAGFVGAVASDAMRLMMGANKSTTTTVAGIGSEEPVYQIDEDSEMSGLTDEGNGGLMGTNDNLLS
jgi:hypothetical protein